jgi:hypothetical protein
MGCGVSAHHGRAKGALMAFAVVLKFLGGTLEQYDMLIAKMGFQPGEAGAPHSLFHWAAATDDGIQLTDVWDSRRAFEQFATEQIGPLAGEVGLPGPPEITFYEVHNYLTAR